MMLLFRPHPKSLSDGSVQCSGAAWAVRGCCCGISAGKGPRSACCWLDLDTQFSLWPLLEERPAWKPALHRGKQRLGGLLEGRVPPRPHEGRPKCELLRDRGLTAVENRVSSLIYSRAEFAAYARRSELCRSNYCPLAGTQQMRRNRRAFGEESPNISLLKRPILLAKPIPMPSPL